MLRDYFPILVMTGIATFMAVMVLMVSSLVHPRNPYRDKLKPWECGVEPVGEADRGRFRIHFFIVAILFIIFDVETLFLFPWAVILADKTLSLFVFVEMVVFIVILAVGLIYAWVKGALDWV